MNKLRLGVDSAGHPRGPAIPDFAVDKPSANRCAGGLGARTVDLFDAGSDVVVAA